MNLNVFSLCFQATKNPKATNGGAVKKSPRTAPKLDPKVDPKVDPNSTEEIELPDPDEPNGFDKGLTPKQIVGATELNGHILFLIQWYVVYS